MARMALCYLPVLFLWFIFASQMQLSNKIAAVNSYDSLRIFLLVVSVAPYLIFDKRDWKMMLIAVAPAVVSFLFFEKILSFYEVGYQEMGIEEYGYELMQMRTLVAYVILSAASFTFQSIIHKNDVYNAQFAASLKEKSDEIEAQNEEMVAIQAQLSDMNNHLEKEVKKRTEELKISNDKLVRQNVQLTEYAFFNSHKLRAPVASILGLVSLIENKNATQEDHKVIIEKIQKSATYLDNVIDEINAILEGKKDD
jgi:signal transduction histidine kinase